MQLRKFMLKGSVLFSVASALSTIAPLFTKNQVPNPAVPQDDLDSFHEWADSQQIERKVEVYQDATAGGGRGLIATQRIQPGQVAVKVPLKATLRLEDKPEYNLDDHWAGLLAQKLHIQALAGRDSQFAPYVANLPKQAPLTPCRWNSDQLRNLQNQTFVTLIHENSDWRQRQLVNHNIDHTHAADYMKWLDLVCSRTLKGRDGSRQLVPLIDIANHAPSEAGGGHFRVDNDYVYLIAGTRGVPEGQPVTLDYGGRHVDDFLLHYAFVPNRCVSDAVKVQLGHEIINIRWTDIPGFRGHESKAVRKACAKLLESFPTTMQEDAVILNERRAGGEAEYWAVSYRYAKKSLLASAVGIQQSASTHLAYAFL